MRAMKITAINAQAKAILQAKIDATTIVPRKMITGPAEGRAAVLEGNYRAQAYTEDYRAGNLARVALEVDLAAKSYSLNPASNIRLISEYNATHMAYLEQNWDDATPEKPPWYLSVQDNSSVSAALETPPVALPVGPKRVTPFVYQKGNRAAWTRTRQGQIVVFVKVEADDDDTRYGFIPASDYNRAGGPPLGPPYTPPSS
jgi:hypothetical protein